MKTVAEIIEELGGAASLSRRIAVRGASTISEWKRAGSIPVRYWLDLIRVAHADGISLNEKILVRAHTIAPPSAESRLPSPPSSDDGDSDCEAA